MRGNTALLACGAVLVSIACGNLPEKTIPQELPNPVVGPLPPVPSVTPTPSFATPTPAPTPTPSATPTPSPSPSPSGSSCRLPSQAECGGPEGPTGVYGCCRKEGTQVFAAQVEAAIVQIQRDRPDLFSGDRVRDPDAYVQGVARILEQRFGLCARQGGPEDEVAVKNANSFSEQYDILFGNGGIRHEGYTVTCRPARF